MKKMPRGSRSPQRPITSESPDVPTASLLFTVLSDSREDLHELIVRTGLDVFRAMLEDERTSVCGLRSRPSADRTAYRHGYDDGELVLGGRKVLVKKPRVRSADGARELGLPLWNRMARRDPLTDRVLEQMLVGVSTRNYARSLEPLPAPLRSRGTTRSAVSRHFVARTQAQVENFLSRSLEDETYPVLMIDGKGFGEHSADRHSGHRAGRSEADPGDRGG